MKFKLSVFHRIKQIGIVSFAVLVILFTGLSTSRADINSDISRILYYVRLINSTTNSMLQVVNQLPTAINNVAVYLLNIVQSDTSAETAALQNSFAGLSKILYDNTDVDADLQNKLLNNLFGATKLTNLNDLLYTNVLTPNSPNIVNYISNVGGLNIKHYTPDGFEFKNDMARQNYASFYNSIMAISSFNAYVLSNMKNDNNLTEVQKKLISQAGDSKWFAKIASDDAIGSILRRILMFQSQQFLFFNELMKTQKQLLYAQIMTNTLLINYGRTDESMILKNSIK